MGLKSGEKSSSALNDIIAPDVMDRENYH